MRSSLAWCVCLCVIKNWLFEVILIEKCTLTSVLYLLSVLLLLMHLSILNAKKLTRVSNSFKQIHTAAFYDMTGVLENWNAVHTGCYRP